MNEGLNDRTYENYCIVSSHKEMAIEEHISRSMEGAISLSSRTMIRNAIEDYHEGSITFTELSDYTASRYADGVEALDNIVHAARIVDDKIVSEVGKPLQNGNYEALDTFTEGTFKVTQEGEAYFIEVISPIANDQTIIGYDVVTFSMTDLIETLNEGDANLIFIEASSQTQILEDAKVLKNPTNYALVLKNEEVTYVSEGIMDSDNLFLSISIPQDVLESEIRSLTNRSLTWMIFLIVSSFILVASLSVKNVSSKLKKEQVERLYFQIRANKDALTGAYTRHYFDFWLMRFKSNFDGDMNPIAVVMTDINGFKKFNDTYGHKAGDQALKDITSIFESSIRKDDLFIRYGGDEFLFVFTQCDEALCAKIMKRIDSEIQNLHEDNDLSLAYGYAIVNDPDAIKRSIDKADKKMYNHKHHIEEYEMESN